VAGLTLYSGAFAGNRSASFTSAVEIVNIGGTWQTVANTLVYESYRVLDTYATSDGIFDRGEWVNISIPGIPLFGFVFRGVTTSFGGGIILQAGFNGQHVFLDYDGTYGGEPNSSGGQNIDITLKDLVVCFVAGTKIRTPEGEKAIEELQIGDLISTANGVKALKFVCQNTRSFNELLATGKNPIRVAAGIFGATADLLMSPSHAINLVGNLIEAGALIDHASVERVTEWNATELTYFNLELDQHELIWANGVATESYFSSYRTNGFSRQSWDNYSEYVALYGEGELMQELDMPRIAFSRQIPAAVAAKLELNTEAKELALV
jgi:hypothetical protein